MKESTRSLIHWLHWHYRRKKATLTRSDFAKGLVMEMRESGRVEFRKFVIDMCQHLEALQKDFPDIQCFPEQDSQN